MRRGGEQVLEEANDGGRIAIYFPQSWPAVRYDASSFHKARMVPSQDAKAIDFLIESPTEDLWIEVKSYLRIPVDISARFSDAPTPEEKEAAEILRTHSNPKAVVVRRKEPALGTEVAAKIRDTMLGLTAALRAQDGVLQAFGRNLVTKRPIRAVFVLEVENSLGDFKLLAKGLQTSISQRLRLLDDHEINVVNAATGSGDPHWRIEFTPPSGELASRKTSTPPRKSSSAPSKAGGKGKRLR